VLNFSPEKLLVIGILALVVLGPNRLPGAARNVGRVVAQMRRMSGSLQSEVRDALAEPRQALQHAVDEFGIDEFRSSVSSFRDSINPLAATSPPAAPTPPSGQTGQPSARSEQPAAASGQSTAAPAPDDPSLN
jgi:sec-independent protein translocase protein TatB